MDNALKSNRKGANEHENLNKTVGRIHTSERAIAIHQLDDERFNDMVGSTISAYNIFVNLSTSHYDKSSSDTKERSSRYLHMATLQLHDFHKIKIDIYNETNSGFPGSLSRAPFGMLSMMLKNIKKRKSERTLLESIEIELKDVQQISKCKEHGRLLLIYAFKSDRWKRLSIDFRCPLCASKWANGILSLAVIRKIIQVKVSRKDGTCKTSLGADTSDKRTYQNKSVYGILFLLRNVNDGFNITANFVFLMISKVEENKADQRFKEFMDICHYPRIASLLFFLGLRTNDNRVAAWLKTWVDQKTHSPLSMAQCIDSISTLYQRTSKSPLTTNPSLTTTIMLLCATLVRTSIIYHEHVQAEGYSQSSNDVNNVFMMLNSVLKLLHYAQAHHDLFQAACHVYHTDDARHVMLMLIAILRHTRDSFDGNADTHSDLYTQCHSDHLYAGPSVISSIEDVLSFLHEQFVGNLDKRQALLDISSRNDKSNTEWILEFMLERKEELCPIPEEKIVKLSPFKSPCPDRDISNPTKRRVLTEWNQNVVHSIEALIDFEEQQGLDGPNEDDWVVLSNENLSLDTLEHEQNRKSKRLRESSPSENKKLKSFNRVPKKSLEELDGVSEAVCEECVDHVIQTDNQGIVSKTITKRTSEEDEAFQMEFMQIMDLKEILANGRNRMQAIQTSLETRTAFASNEVIDIDQFDSNSTVAFWMGKNRREELSARARSYLQLLR